LTEAGVDCARQEATIALQHVTGQSPTEFYANLQRTILPTESTLLESILARRLQHEPLQYILGSAHFYGCEFYVNSRVLIPRPESELLVDVTRDLLPGLAPTSNGPWFVDVGTGSGSVAITLAREFPQARILAVDRSRDALQVAFRNVTTHAVGARVHLLQCDLLSALRHGFSIIAANLPYVKTDDIAVLSPEVSHFEPHQALDGGADGLAAISRLCSQAPHVLIPGGWLMLEVGEGQAAEVSALLARQNVWDSLSTFTDLRGIPRVVAGRLALKSDA
jgi:release factor glutamine methyltransferase